MTAVPATHLGGGVPAWCGHCGESFVLSELLAGDRPGDCPRCGAALAPSYSTVLVAALRQFGTAVESLSDAAKQLTDVAPAVHIDHRAIAALLARHLEH